MSEPIKDDARDLLRCVLREHDDDKALLLIEAFAAARVAEAHTEWAKYDEAIRAEARAQERALIKNSLDIRLNEYLCDMREGYDDGFLGFNDAWDVVRLVLAEPQEKL